MAKVTPDANSTMNQVGKSHTVRRPGAPTPAKTKRL